MEKGRTHMFQLPLQSFRFQKHPRKGKKDPDRKNTTSDELAHWAVVGAFRGSLSDGILIK